MSNPPANHKCWNGGKVSYSKRFAQIARNNANNEGRVKLEIYQCKNCNYWHLTHKKDR